MPRVLSTSEARDAIQRMQSIIGGGLTEQLGQLKAQGQQLCDPNVWDGALAGQFRGTWPQTAGTLDRIASELEELRIRVDRRERRHHARRRELTPGGPAQEHACSPHGPSGPRCL